MRNVLFVCTGNTCRSPLAAALARRMAGKDVEIESAGTHASDGAAAMPEAVTVACEHNLDLSAHRARRLTGELVDRADVLVAFGREAADAVEALGGGTRTRLLAIDDPYRRGLEEYRRAFTRLEWELPAILETL
jgi:protein-tyrosine-phosphatase